MLVDGVAPTGPGAANTLRIHSAEWQAGWAEGWAEGLQVGQAPDLEVLKRPMCDRTAARYYGQRSMYFCSTAKQASSRPQAAAAFAAGQADEMQARQKA